MKPSNADVWLPLKGGYLIRESVWRWLVEQSSTFEFRVLDDGRLWVGPRERLSDADVAFIREHKQELIDAVRYCDALAAEPL